MMVCLDTDCTIYLVEQHPTWGPKIVARLAALRVAGHALAVSDLVRTECLAGPLRSGQVQLVADYQSFFGDPDSPCCRYRRRFANEPLGCARLPNSI